MSKERELLKRWLAGEANQIPTHVPLLIETQNLLAQPEAIAPEREFIRLWYENIELWKEVQTKSQTKQEPKVCPNKMSSGKSCMLPEPLCGYPNCEK